MNPIWAVPLKVLISKWTLIKAVMVCSLKEGTQANWLICFNYLTRRLIINWTSSYNLLHLFVLHNDWIKFAVSRERRCRATWRRGEGRRGGEERKSNFIFHTWIHNRSEYTNKRKQTPFSVQVSSLHLSHGWLWPFHLQCMLFKTHLEITSVQLSAAPNRWLI